MNEQPTSHETRMVILLAIAIASIVGAITGAVSSLVVSQSLISLPFTSQSDISSSTDKAIVSMAEEEAATISVVERLAPSVVSIVVKKKIGDLDQSDSFLFFDDLFLVPQEEESTEPKKEDGDEYIEIGGGTGFFVSIDGLLVTNKHVIQEEDAIFVVVTDDGSEYDAILIATDPIFDIAVLKVEGGNFSPVFLGDSDTIRVGQTVIAIGNTLSTYRNTVTKGVISGIDRRVSAGISNGASEVIDHAIQTDAAINPGNSGGPLINLFGEVIGMNTAISVQGDSIGFAIPINEVANAADQVRQSGRIVRPWLGVRYVMISEEIADKESLSSNRGALLVAGNYESQDAVAAGSPAEIAQLLEGDIILSVEGIDLTEEYTLADSIRAYSPEKTITLSILRDQNIFTVSITLAEFQAE